MNFINGTIQHQDECYFFRVSADCAVSIGVEIPEAVKIYHARTVLVGLRPEHIFINEQDMSGKAGHMLQVTAYENMGNEQLVYLSLAGQTLIVR